MPAELVDAFFSVTDSGAKVGFVVQGGQAARFGWAEERMLDHYAPLLGKRWPALPAAFTGGFDAALATPADDPWTMVFRGSQCLRLHPVDGSVGQVGSIDGQYPGLPAAFRAGIDAALPAATAGEAYFFKGGQCVRYDLRSEMPVETMSLADTWQGLSAKAPAFVNGISAAAVNPVTGKAFFFKGSQFVRVALSTRTVETAAAPVDEGSWPGLRRTFSPGRVYVVQRIGESGDPISAAVVDLATRTVTGTLDMPLNVTRSISPTPDGRFLYVATMSGYVCVDAANHQVVATFPRLISYDPANAYSPDGTHYHFTSWQQNGDSSYSNYLETVQVGTFNEVSRIELKATVFAGATTTENSSRAPVVLGGPYRIAPHRDGRFVYISGGVMGRGPMVAEVDLEQKLVRQLFPLSGQTAPNDLALSPDGLVAHTAAGGRTLAFSTRTGEILLQGVLPASRELALTPDGSTLLCLPNADGEGVLVADPATHQLQDRIPIEATGGRGTGSGLSLSHGGAFAYVAEVSEDSGYSLAVIDVEARQKVASISLPGDRVFWAIFAPF
ncbi:hemopexin repeat-containing protein [Streptosporangium amethystogenes subsp. fukuiense]|uniref:Hemopexin repeat-containing protein n=2 Tax=Streptosporangium amethystogenes TaxID=2002 RepID=A0ABW2SSL1_9ACTN